MKKYMYTLIWTMFFSCQMLQGNWTPPEDLSPAQTPFQSLAQNNKGQAIVIWLLQDNRTIQGARIDCSGVWTDIPDLDGRGPAVRDVKVTLDECGNAVAIWLSEEGDRVLHGARLPAGSSVWIYTTDLTLPNDFAFSPLLAIDGHGNAVATFTVFDGISSRVNGATLSLGELVWQPTSIASPLGQDVENARLGVDCSGYAVSVWLNSDGFFLQAATLQTGSHTWVPTTDITEPGEIESEFFPSLAVARETGNAVVTWTQGSLPDVFVLGATLAFGSNTWVRTNPVSPPNAGLSFVTVDAVGNAVSIFFGQLYIQGATLELGSIDWVLTDPLTPPGIPVDGLNLAETPGGVALAVAGIPVGPDTVTFARTLLPGKQIWEPAVQLTPIGASYTPEATSIDCHNNAVVILNRSEGVFDFTLSQTVNFASIPNLSSIEAHPCHVPADGETAATITVTLRDCGCAPIAGNTVVLTASGGRSVISPVSGVTDANGQVIFEVTDTVGEKVTYTVFDSSSYVTIGQVEIGFNPIPPTHFHGKVIRDIMHRHLRTHVLTWKLSHDPSVVGYRIYENGKIIAKTGSKVFSTLITNRLPHVSYTYSLVAVNAQGVESAPLTITSPG